MNSYWLMRFSLNMFIWWLIYHNSIPEVLTTWTTPILAYLHAPKNCMSSCIRLQEIACICNFYTHATCWWWVSLNLCGPQECCQGDENIFIFVCIKWAALRQIWLVFKRTAFEQRSQRIIFAIMSTIFSDPKQVLDNFLIQQTLIFFSIAALWPWYECAAFEYTHQAHSSNLNFHFS